jgi:hypothetical protein
VSCYTLSNCFLNNLGSGTRYVTEILFKFAQESNAFKISIDNNGKVLELYRECAQSNSLVAEWVKLMGVVPVGFEMVDVNIPDSLSSEEIFLKVCSHSGGQKKLIIHTHQSWQNFSYHMEDNLKIILYDNNSVLVLDRDEAVDELRTSNSITNNTINNSVVGIGAARLSDVNIS